MNEHMKIAKIGHVVAFDDTIGKVLSIERSPENDELVYLIEDIDYGGQMRVLAKNTITNGDHIAFSDGSIGEVLSMGRSPDNGEVEFFFRDIKTGEEDLAPMSDVTKVDGTNR